MIPSSGLINLLGQLKELREKHSPVLLRVMIKYTNERLGEEMHRTKSGRVPSSGTSVSVELWYVTLLVWMCSPT